MTPRYLASAAAVVAAAGWGLGCATAPRPGNPAKDGSRQASSTGGWNGAGTRAPPGGSSGESAPALRPTSIRIHPLTRFGRDENGRLELVGHVELKDRYGQSVKGLGLLRFELYRPAPPAPGSQPGSDPAGETQEAVWTVDLRDPDDNAAAYDDLVTRTYTVRLGSVPESIASWLEEGAAGEEDGSWLTLRAYFTLAGGERVLSAAQRMQR